MRNKRAIKKYMRTMKKIKIKHTYDDIVSVVILEQTQLYKRKSNWGLAFGGHGLSDSHVIAMDGGQIPDGAVITFSVTYKDGEKEIIKERSGTDRCDRLLQLSVDPPVGTYTEGTEKPSKQYTPIELQKNQLPNGSYIIGKDIPIGIFDFSWIFGSGMITKYKNDHDTTLEATTYFQHMGSQYDYEYRQCLNVECTEGERLVINGNLVVQIARSKKVEIDL